MSDTSHRILAKEFTIAASLDDIDLKVAALARGPRTAAVPTGTLYASTATGLTISTIDMDALSRAKVINLDKWFSDSGSGENPRSPAFRITITPDGEAAQTWDVDLRECGQVWLYMITTARPSAGVGTLTIVVEGVGE